MTNEDFINTLEDMVSEVCNCVDNCGNCKFFSIEKDECVRDEYIRERVNGTREGVSKPPLGVVPKNIYYTLVYNERVADLSRAISEYAAAQREIPIEWVEEYNEILNNLI